MFWQASAVRKRYVRRAHTLCAFEPLITRLLYSAADNEPLQELVTFKIVQTGKI